MGEKESVSFWDNIGSQFGSQFLLDEPVMEQLIDSLFNSSEIAGGIILDAGCGNGVSSIVFAKKGARKAIGVDISQASLTTAREIKEQYGLENIDFLLGDIERLPFKAEAFDHIWAWGSLCYLRDPYQGIDELIRVLNPEGTMVILLVRRTGLTRVHAMLGNMLRKIPQKWKLPLARALARLGYPLKYALKTDARLKGGKTLPQKVLEWYFSPTPIHAFSYEEVKRYLHKKGLTDEERILPASDRYNPLTGLVVKARKCLLRQNTE